MLLSFSEHTSISQFETQQKKMEIWIYDATFPAGHPHMPTTLWDRNQKNSSNSMKSCASTHAPKKSVHVNDDFILFTVHLTTLCWQLEIWNLQKNKSSLQELCHKSALDFHLNSFFVVFGPLCFSNHCQIFCENPVILGEQNVQDAKHVFLPQLIFPKPKRLVFDGKQWDRKTEIWEDNSSEFGFPKCKLL